VKNLRIERLPRVTHWTPEDGVGEVNALLDEWLKAGWRKRAFGHAVPTRALDRVPKGSLSNSQPRLLPSGSRDVGIARAWRRGGKRCATI